MDELEKKLQRQTPRKIPGEWRAEILNAALASTTSQRASRFPHRGLLWTLKHQLAALLWPHPKAWAGLAAIWLAVLSMNFYTAEPTTQIARKEAPPSPELILALQQQRLELARLIEPNVAPDADKPKIFRPSPRSERRDQMLAA